MKKFIIIFVFLVVVSSVSKSQSWGTTGNTFDECNGIRLGTLSPCPLRLFTNDTLRMIINPLGLVGVGLDNPADIFHVHNDRLKTATFNPASTETEVKPFRIMGLLNQTYSFSESSILLTNFYTGKTSTDGLKISTRGNEATFFLQEEGLMQFKTTKTTTLNFEVNGNISIKNNTNDVFCVKPDGNSFFTGNLGVKTGIPVSDFQVVGNSTFSANTTNAITSAAYIRGMSNYSNANTPDYTWYKNEKTGMFHPATNTIGFSTNGVERIRINQDGRVGIGTDNPITNLQIGNKWLFQYQSNRGKLIGKNTYYDWDIGQEVKISASESASRITMGDNGNIVFQTADFVDGNHIISWHTLMLDYNGNVGIGTNIPQTKLDVNGDSWFSGKVGIGAQTVPSGYKLAVYGKILCEEVVCINPQYWPDYIFGENYKLPKLFEVELFINKNKHLPGVPTAKEVEENGISLGEMNKILLEKIEEQMLYIIDLQKQINKQQEEINQLKDKETK